MTRFYIHVHQCDIVALDDEGMECVSLDVTRKHALEGARGIMCEELMKGRLCLGCHIEIEDEHRRVVAIVPFRESVTITGLA